MSSQAHEAAAERALRDRRVRCAVLTVSDTRTAETDTGGQAVARHLGEGGHSIADRRLVRDDPPAIRSALEGWLHDRTIDAIISTGGTGIGTRDSTVDIVRDLLTHELEGFGELFRMLSFEAIGPAAMMSRAVGGLASHTLERGGDTFVFSLPGSVNAVDLAMTRLIVPQLAHLVWERRR